LKAKELETKKQAEAARKAASGNKDNAGTTEQSTGGQRNKKDVFDQYNDNKNMTSVELLATFKAKMGRRRQQVQVEEDEDEDNEWEDN
jgi:hypothetical protein